MKNLTLIVPQKYRQIYIEERMNTNFMRLLMMGFVILIIQLFAISLNLFNPFTQIETIIKHYMHFYYMTTSANIAFLAAGVYIKKRKVSKSILGAFIHLYAFSQVFWAAGVALADQFQGEQIVVYYALLLTFAIILDIETPNFFIIVIINHLMFFWLLTIFERFYEPVYGLRSTASQIVFFILGLRYYLHELLKRNFIQKEDLKAQNEALEFYANYDALTNVYNRRKWEHEFQSAYAKSLQMKSSLGIVIVDVDSFKEYNDHYGHIKGDEVLERVGVILQETSENFGLVPGRFGGDEFVLLVQNPSSQKMKNIIETLYSKIENLNIEHQYARNGHKLSLSAGGYHGIPNENETMWQFASHADEALYAEKAKKAKNIVNIL